MKCEKCGVEYTTPFCPNGCNTPSAPYLTQRQQDHQGCPFCGSSRIQAKNIQITKKHLFRPATTKDILVRVCSDCGETFR